MAWFWRTSTFCALLGMAVWGWGQAEAAQLGPQLKHLMAFRDGLLPIDASFAPRSVHADGVRVYLVFDAPPDSDDIRGLEASGVRFTRFGDDPEPAHVGLIYGVKVPWPLVPVLAKDARIARIEAVERRGMAPAMDLSMPEIAWSDGRFMPQSGTDGLTGRGQRIADFDTSLDIFHPAFFKPDGGAYEWLDVDGDGELTPDVDAVDLDGDGVPQESEILRLLENALFDVQYGPLQDGYFDADQDWLYADTDGDGERDFGAEKGFGERDPGFGEPLFIADDADGDGELDVGEALIRLGTSKVYAAMDGESSKTYHYRGSSLLTMARDVYPHGTSVAGILLGDVPGRRFVGVAPDAELLSINTDAGAVDLISAMSWAKTQRADVMLYSFGDWIGEFLDGTSEVERAVATMAEAGIPQVCPAGNIGNNNKHGMTVAPVDGDALGIFFVDGTFNASVVYLTALWRQQYPVLTFSIEFISPDGISPNTAVTVVEGTTQTNGQGDYVTAIRSTSNTGTNMLDMTLYHKEGGVSVQLKEGLYTVKVANSGISNAKLHLFLGDDRTTWAGGATWITSDGSSPGAIADPDYSVSSPATSDACIVVGSYATRQRDLLGNLSTFSSRGPRIDEQSLLDVAAPGNYDIYSPASSAASYYDASIQEWSNYPPASSWLFSGTSASAPHVAGAAALLRQINEDFTHDEVENALRNAAKADNFTGSVPNESWGMGKLQVVDSLQYVDDVAPTFSVLVARHPVLAKYLIVTVVPSERLSGPPTLTSTTTTVGTVSSAGNDVYTSAFRAPASGSTIALSVSGQDLAGNTGAKSASYQY